LPPAPTIGGAPTTSGQRTRISGYVEIGTRLMPIIVNAEGHAG